MKKILVECTAVWTTTLEVPDDFEFTEDNVEDLVRKEKPYFDYQNGGAEWEVSSAECGDDIIQLD